ncbi:MAG: LPS export ABC transporter periplasmic protein LptC [Pseudomonadota bacterium]
MDAPIDGHPTAGQPPDLDRTGGSGARRRERRTARGIGTQDSAEARKRAFARARRNTSFVRILRRLMPIGAIALVVVYVGSAFRNFEFTSGLPALPIPQITTKDLTMNNPRYSGFTNDGGSYDVAAKTARQDFSKKNRIELAGITGTLTDASKVVTKLKADTGVFATQTSVLDLAGNIAVVATNGMAADLSQARIDTKAGTITSTEPVRVQMNENRIDAKTLEVQQKKKTAVFRGDVVATLNPQQDNQPTTEAKPKAGDATALGQMMGQQSGPVTVTSERLNVDDGAGQAAFVGSVVARQGDAEMQTAQLDIAYGDDGKTNAGAQRAAPGFGGQGNVKTITAPGAVTITRGAGQTVTARQALFQVKDQTALLSGDVRLVNGPGQTATGDQVAFDAQSNRAVLSGNVVLSGGPDQRAIAKRAEFDTASDVAVLTGDVVVSQGKNILRGGSLFVDRKAGITRMTTPPGTGSTPGRISADLAPQGKPKGAKKRSKSAGSGAGGLASFQTDPNAPVSIEAARLDVDDAKNAAIFRGNVIAKQGGFSLKTAALKAIYTGSAALGDPGAPLGSVSPSKNKSASDQAQTQIKTIRADGDVVVSSVGGQKATGDWATFDLQKNMVTVGGDVLLSQGKTVVRGTQLTIDMASGRSRITTQSAGAAGGWSTEQPPSAIVKAPDGGTVRSGFGMRGGRPSLMLYPQDLQSRKKGAKDAAGSAWKALTKPQ